MRQMTWAARSYLGACYLLGLAALGWLLAAGRAPAWPADWLLALGLAAAAGIAQVLTVERANTNYSDHLTPAPVFAALLLLPSPLLALVIVATFVPEWIVRRRPWYIQVFNIASWLSAAALGHAVLVAVAGGPLGATVEAAPAGAVALALAAFLGAQVAQLAVALKLARGRSFRESGLFAPGKLVVDAALLCCGWAGAAAWLIDPLYALAAAAPLVLIFQALHVPNLRAEAATDPKTGLANMRSFNEALARELDRAAEGRQPLSLLLCDLDHLRDINNDHGHQAGDAVIGGVADIIRRSIRGGDCAARFGGEEFVVLLPATDRASAWQVAERIRALVERQAFAAGAGRAAIAATMSIGIAGYPADGGGAEALMREADLALYQAKREGRNRVVAANQASRQLVGEWTRDRVDSRALAGKLRLGLDDQAGVATRSAPAAVATPPRPGGARATGSGPAARRAPPPRPVALTIAAVVALAVGALAQGLLARPPDPSLPVMGLALFAALVLLAEQLAIEVDGRGKTSVSVVAIIGAGLVYHELGILVTAGVFALWAKAKAKSPTHRMLFNFGAIALAGLGATAAFDRLGPGVLAGAPFHERLLPAAVAGLAYYAINHALLCLVRGLSERRRIWQVWQAHYRWLWPHYPVLGMLAAVVATGYVAFGWAGLLALGAPVAMMHLAFRQYLARTRAYVGELQRLNRQLETSYEATLEALSRALDTRDEETEEHSRRVQRYTELIARRHGLPEEEVEPISRGALLHDIGKIGVPDAILLKPGRLSAAERAVMQRHPVIGHAMIAHIPFLAKAAEVVLHHHEAFDGGGYPSGLAGEAIPLGARIFAVVDALDAMTSDRPYRRAMSFPSALAEIERCRGRQFDPRIVDVLLAIAPDELLAHTSGLHGADAPLAKHGSSARAAAGARRVLEGYQPTGA